MSPTLNTSSVPVVSVERGGATEMLIDRYLPRFDVTHVEHVVVDADRATVWWALRELDLMQVHTPLLDAAFFLRGLPARAATWLGRSGQTQPPPPQINIAGGGLAVEGWLSLGEIADYEIALGAVGRFWQPNIEWYDVRAMSPEQFAAFDQPGWGRIAVNFSLRPYGLRRTLLSYEARTATCDAESSRRFARYWRVMRPFVGHIMRAALNTVRRDAELSGG